MIGSFERAKDLLLCAIMEQSPETFGFEFVGGGAYRNAYRDGNVVYKVDKNILEGKRYSGYNYSEWVGICKFAGTFPLTLQGGNVCRIAEAQLYDFGRACILAQEYVPYSSNYGPIEYADYHRVLSWYEVSDLHANNYRVDDNGDVVLIDLGFNDSEYGNEVYIECSECGEGHYQKRKFPEAEANAIVWADVIKAWRR